MKNFTMSMLLLIVAAGIATPRGYTQDLAALANKTKADRMKTKMQRSVRVWTNDNMPKRPAGEGPTAAGGMSVTPSAAHSGDTPEPPPEPPQNEPPAEADAAAINDLRSQIKQAKEHLAGLEERQRLSEDELNLLMVQQASELAPDTQATLA